MNAFMPNEDLSRMFLSEWVDFQSIGKLDVAITNRRTRILWLQQLLIMSVRNVDKWLHSHSSMRWLITRGLRVSSIQINSKYSESITDLTFEGIDASNLRDINLDGCKLVVFLKLNKCPLLLSISLRDCSISDACVRALGAGCPNLQSINLSISYGYGWMIRDVAMASLSGCPWLNTINFSGCLGITDEGVKVITNHCIFLQNVDFNDCRHLTGISVLALSKKSFIQRLRFSRCRNISHTDYSVLADRCPYLLSIDLSYCFIRDQDVFTLLRGHPNLESIYLQNCQLLTDTVAEVLSYMCPELHTVDLLNCRNITDAGVQFLAERCAQLKDVSFGCNKRITHVGVSALGSKCPLLRSINLKGLKRVTNAGILAIAKGCPLLESINLSGCLRITDAAISAVGRGCSFLQNIELSECHGINVVGVSVICHVCPLLKSVVLTSCRRITDADVATLRHSYPQVQFEGGKGVPSAALPDIH